MIAFDQVTKHYGAEREALKQVSFTVAPGELTFLTGHSGAGKSTLLKLIMLMERPTSGRVAVCGYDTAAVGSSAIPFYRRQIGMVFQNHQLLFDRSVFDNVALPLLIAGFHRRDAARRVRAALDKLGLLDKEHLNPKALSGGEQQRVGIARAVVNKPPVLIADEPTGNLDPELSSEIMGLFQQFAHYGVTVLIATHDVELIEQYPHRRLVLSQGRLGADSGSEFDSDFGSDLDAGTEAEL